MEFDTILREILSKSTLKRPVIYTIKDNELENIEKSLLYEIRDIHNLEKSDLIYHAYIHREFKAGSFFEADRTYYESALILEGGVSMRKIEQTTGWLKVDDFEVDICWHEIEDIEIIFKDVEDENGKKIKHYYIRFYSLAENQYLDVPLYNFGRLSSVEDAQKIVNLLNTINAAYKNYVADSDNKFIERIEEIEILIEKEKFSEAIDVLDKEFSWDEIKDIETLFVYVIELKAKAFQGIEKYLEGITLINDALPLFNEFKGIEDFRPKIYGLKGIFNLKLHNYNIAIEDFYTAMSNCEKRNDINFYRSNLEMAYSKLQLNFFSLDYGRRRTVLVYDKIKPSSLPDFPVLDKANLPENIIFPVGHPKINEVYVAHPYLTKVYTPYNLFEETLFDSRFEEFSYFLQCLGAKSITINVINGKETSSSEGVNSNVSGTIGVGKKVIKNKIEASADSNITSQINDHVVSARRRTQIYTPTRKPYIPENLLWYHNEPSWQYLYLQRVNGNILEHHDIITSKSSHSFTKSEKTALKMAFQNFFTDANLEVDNLVENTFSDIESIEWEIFVEFESLDNLKEFNPNADDNSNLLNENQQSKDEAEYIEEIKYMLEDDGVIDEKERSILERLRRRKGINKERAEQLEKSVLFTNGLTEDEKEYLAEYKEIISDGIITDKERRILNRYACRLSLSSDRIEQIEKMI